MSAALTAPKPRVRVGTDGSLRGLVPARGAGAPGAAYMRGGISPTFAGWQPALRDASDEVRMSWDRATARALDVLHNSGWISGSIDQAVANTVGTGLRLSSMPDANALGMTASEASVWARNAERRHELWARRPMECDIEGRRTFGQMQVAAFKGWFPTGEIVAEIAWRRRPGCQYGTKVRLIPPHRLSQRTEFSDLAQGVRVDPDGLPVGYVFRRREFGPTSLIERDIEVPARDETGRARIVHVFDGTAGTVRGITPLVPALQVARQFDQLSDATLTASLIRAVFAATLVSDGASEEAFTGLLTQREQQRIKSGQDESLFDAWSAMQEGWYKNTTIDVGIKGRFAHLLPGQKLEFQTAGNSASDYRDQALFLLRELLRCLGLTYESGTGDYTNATYSSVRMATGEIFQINEHRATTSERKRKRPQTLAMKGAPPGALFYLAARVNSVS